MSSGPLSIRALSDAVINQIAAGEVIERPSAVVKELLENALDAGARSIEIELDQGGIDRIRIRDDGAGIPPQELALAVTRHCTSKLSSGLELAAIRTLGFRGEALASIAAVADLDLVSRPNGSTHGWQFDANRPDRAPTPAPHPPGTTIEMRGLFARTPARRRFLKRPQTEYLHALQVVRRIAFCRPEVTLRLVHDGRVVLDLRGAVDAVSAARRLRALFGAAFARDARPLEASSGALRLNGFVATADWTRQQPDLQFFGVNARIVRDRHLAHAVRAAYGDGVAEGRYPCYALRLELPHDEVDVNVHPGKLEVRFEHARDVHDFVHSAVRRELAGEQVALSLAEQTVTSAPAARVAEREPSPRYQPAVTAAKSAPRGSAAGAAALAAAPLAEIALGALDGRWVLFDLGETMGLLDARDALETVLVARLEGAASRPLLVPERVSLTTPLTDEVAAGWRAVGVELTALAQDVAALRALPVVLPEVDTAALAAYLGETGLTRAAPASTLAAAAARAQRIPRSGQALQRWAERFVIQLGAAGRSLRAELVEIEPAELAARARGRGGRT